MDIVYLVKNSPTNEELTYSLRSLENISHEKVFLVGGCPHNIDRGKVIYIPTLQGPNKYKNTTLGLKTICEDRRLSEDFILMNDDFFILKPIKYPVSELNLCRGTISEVLSGMRARIGGDTYYTISMAQTDVFLQDLGYKSPLSYELHIPMVINKKSFLGLFLLNYIGSIQYGHYRSIYGNLYLKDSKEVEDVKVYYDNMTKHSDKFLSTEDNSWPLIRPEVEALFPGKSPYEL